MTNKIFSESCLKVNEFNNCPGRDRIREILRDLKIFDSIAYVNLEDPYWENDQATMVFAIDRKTIDVALRIGIFARNVQADEFDFKIVNDGSINYYVIRIWWD
jgi:hypothetical protein